MPESNQMIEKSSEDTPDFLVYSFCDMFDVFLICQIVFMAAGKGRGSKALKYQSNIYVLENIFF